MNKVMRILLGSVIVVLVVSSLAYGQQTLTLEKAVSMALEQNPELRAAKDQADAAQARIAEARAGWFPRFDVSQEFTRGDNPVYVFGTLLTQRQFTAANFALPGLNVPPPLDNFRTSLTGQISLFDSGRTYLREKGSRKIASAADFRTAQARQDLILRVVNAYFGVTVAREDWKAAEGALRAAQSNEDRIRAMEKSGLVVSSDLLSAEVFRAEMQDREIRARNGLELASLNLGRQLGMPAGSSPEPSESLAAPSASGKSLEEWERLALASRPILRAAEMGDQAALAGKKLAKVEFGPQISMFADLERDAETLGGPSGTNWTAGARVDLNLFSGGADRARLAEATAQEDEARHRLEWLRSGIELEVRQAFLDARAAAERAAAARDASRQASESLRIVENRYQAGLAEITELLRAQTAQLDATTGYLAALHDWQVARAQLEHAAGQLTADSPILSQGANP